MTTIDLILVVVILSAFGLSCYVFFTRWQKLNYDHYRDMAEISRTSAEGWRGLAEAWPAKADTYNMWAQADEDEAELWLCRIPEKKR